jgi:hypothetical protein
VAARFYEKETLSAAFDVFGRYARARGLPRAIYVDKAGIYRAEEGSPPTQFGRAMAALGVELILANSPQAKGRVERSFGTAQDRWVKELRLAKASTCEQANAVLERLLPAHNRRFAKPAKDSRDAHRCLGGAFNLAAILSIQDQRVVSNDYVVRFHNRHYQLLRPIYPGERGGKVIVEVRLDGSVAIRFKEHYLKYQELPVGGSPGGSAPRPPEFSACAADARGADEDKDQGPTQEPQSPGVQPAGGRSGRTPAEPYPPDGEADDTRKPRQGPDKDHPWRKPFKRPK